MSTWSRKPRVLSVLDDAMEILSTLRRIEILHKFRRALTQMQAQLPAPKAPDGVR